MKIGEAYRLREKTGMKYEPGIFLIFDAEWPSSLLSRSLKKPSSITNI
jgi:hypothetical protein